MNRPDDVDVQDVFQVVPGIPNGCWSSHFRPSAMRDIDLFSNQSGTPTDEVKGSEKSQAPNHPSKRFVNNSHSTIGFGAPQRRNEAFGDGLTRAHPLQPLQATTGYGNKSIG